jgi:hypothetical protein
MNPKNGHEKNLDAIDRALAGEEVVVPSSGFVAAAMECIRKEADAPPPIPFPWRLALPGMVLAAGAAGWSAYEAIRSVQPLTPQLALSLPHLSAAAVMSLQDAGWVALALGASLASWLVSRRLAGQTGLL